MTLEYKKYGCTKQSSQHKVGYQFMEPTDLTIRETDGTISNVRVGIGSMVEVWEPMDQLLMALHEKMDEIVLVDGRTIIKYPEYMKTKMITG